MMFAIGIRDFTKEVSPKRLTLDPSFGKRSFSELKPWFLLQICFRESLRWCSRRYLGLPRRGHFGRREVLDNTLCP